MNCERTLDELNAFLDGRLPAGDEARVLEHLAACPRCTAELEDLRRLDQLVDELPGMPVPDGFAARVRRAAAIRPLVASEPQSVGAILFGGALTRVAAAVMVVFGLWVGVSMGGAVSSATAAADTETARSSVEETDPLDLPVGSLSAAPVGSLTEVLLDMTGDDEGGE